MMRKHRENALNKAVDDKTVVVNDFTRRTPFWSYRTVSYREYAPLLNLGKEIDKFLENLFQGEIDDGNGDVLDNLIFDLVRQAEIDLAQQRGRHRDLINSFDIRAKGDRIAFENEKALLEQDLLANLQEQTSLRCRLNKSTYIEGASE